MKLEGGDHEHEQSSGARVRHDDGTAVVELTGEITSAAEGD